MLDLLARNDAAAFDSLESRLRNTLRKIVTPFSRDRMLRRTEGVDSLYNIALSKLDEARRDFRYESTLTPEHNERRFLALLIKYVRNAMIDEQYAANVEKRKPKGTLVSMNASRSLFGANDDDGEFEMELPDERHVVDEISHVNEIKHRVKRLLRGDDERKIFSLLSEGHPCENVAGLLGMLTSRVRYILYEKIQPVVNAVMGRRADA
jgi:hypothetical protein